MFFSIMAGIAIFGYAAWSLIRHVRKIRQGRCAACSLHQSCQSACFDGAGKFGDGSHQKSAT